MTALGWALLWFAGFSIAAFVVWILSGGGRIIGTIWRSFWDGYRRGRLAAMYEAEIEDAKTNLERLRPRVTAVVAAAEGRRHLTPVEDPDDGEDRET